MKKLVLAAASVAALGFATPSFAMDAGTGRVQLAQAGVSVSVGTPVARERVVVHRDRGWHRGHRHHARANHVVIVKKRKAPRKTVIIER